MYRIIGGDGNEYGPATAEQLRQWMSEGRLDAQSRVRREDSGTWTTLADLPELRLPPPVNQVAPAQPPALVARTAPQGIVRHQLARFPTAVVILLHYLTFGIFTLFWLNLMHGKLPRVRSDDPSAGRAVGFCFIPLFNLYWIFFTYRRLCLRLEEQRRLYGLPPGSLVGLATTACIFQIIPYINLFIGFTIMTPVFVGMVQSSVNQLVDASATTAPRDVLPVLQAPARDLSGGVIAAIICACMIPVIGLLAAIAIPSFVKARAASQRTICINHLRLIDDAKDQAALINGYKDGDTVPEEMISSCLKKGLSGLTCPGGGRYTANPVNQDAVCSVHGSAMER